MLRRKRKPKPSYPQTQQLKSVGAPTGGLNARDALANMAETDAVNLVNWIPDAGGVRCRKGFKEWTINVPAAAAVRTVMGYFASNTAFPGGTFISDPTSMPGALFCATDTAIYTITNTTNAPVAAIALSGSSNAGLFSHTQFRNSAGSWLIACSEADGYFTYDGAAWLRRVAGAGAGQINGANPNDFVQCCAWKRRLWFVQKNSSVAWYLPADAIAGTVTAFDFGPLLKRGGHLAYLAAWTIDAGEGIDDFLVAVGSNGDVLVYKGTDPASSATFSLVGSWTVGQIPVGRRGFTQFGGDLIILSADGVFPMSYVTRGGASLLQASDREYASKIKTAIGADLRASFTTLGWQMALHPSERILVVTVPNYGAVIERQYAMSTTMNQWCLLDGIPVYSLGSHAGYMFAGTNDGRVLLLFTGPFDNVAYGTNTGDGIRGVIFPAFSTFGTPALEKHFLMIRPSFIGLDAPGVLAGINVNYDTEDPLGTPTYTTPSTSVWDVALWDSGVWGGQQQVFSTWISVGGVGFAGAAALIVTAMADTVLTSIDYMFDTGGPI